MGIEETKEMLNFALSLGMTADAALADGFQWTDTIALVPSLTKLPAAISGAGEIPAEIEDMDESERAELYEVVGNLELISERTEEITEKALKAAIAVSQLILALREAKTETV